MLQSLAALLGNHNGRSTPTDADVKHVAQTFLRQQTKTDALYCAVLSKGVLEVRVTTAAVAQAVRLLEYDLKRLVEEQTEQTLHKIIVRQR